MRSTHVQDYQESPRPLSVMKKSFVAGASTGWHSHPRGQVLYALQGLMFAETDRGAWAVPVEHALLIPPHVTHNVSMHGDVTMVSAYIAGEAWMPAARETCHVIRVSRLLSAALEQSSQEPIIYALGSRGDHLAHVIFDELDHAQTAAFALPLPNHPKLKEICRLLIEDPAYPHHLDDWADVSAMSRRTFTRKFRDETGLSFSHWKLQLRHLQSMKLSEEGLPLTMIARRLGYSSPQALRAMLRER